MKTRFRVVIVTLLTGFVSALGGEEIPDRQLFTLGCSLRVNAPAPLFLPAASSTTFELETRREVPIELAIQRYEAMNGRPLLSVPERQFEQGGAYGYLKSKVLDPITTFEVVKVGKVKLTGGIVGAVKKKNPFYLLTPLVFAIDW